MPEPAAAPGPAPPGAAPPGAALPGTAAPGPLTAGDGAAGDGAAATAGPSTAQDYARQTTRYLERIAELNPLLGAVTRVSPDALREASARDQESPAPRGPLHGIPVLVKDNIDVRGLDRNPSGSSSGFAVAVAAGLALMAVGTATDASNLADSCMTNAAAHACWPTLTM